MIAHTKAWTGEKEREREELRQECAITNVSLHAECWEHRRPSAESDIHEIFPNAMHRRCKVSSHCHDFEHCASRLPRLRGETCVCLFVCLFD
jgi:hypothetical protein